MTISTVIHNAGMLRRRTRNELPKPMKKYATTKTGNGTAAASSAYATIIMSEAVESVSYTLDLIDLTG